MLIPWFILEIAAVKYRRSESGSRLYLAREGRGSDEAHAQHGPEAAVMRHLTWRREERGRLYFFVGGLQAACTCPRAAHRLFSVDLCSINKPQYVDTRRRASRDSIVGWRTF
ncbi:hypothetical protein NDU88_000898 [Pleurodeles waltl]|uniref:Uncharacterized protein n=1 Tax=Pleurodeles waltl TaxID=8319 RepID=A0AAV7SYC6_PLEWA|nr:hypothetical protein NDU88_000898 [Pleurodeles waltl]